MGSGYHGYSHTQGATERFKPQDLMDELKNSGVKYAKKDVVLVVKNYSGKLLWLQKGNELSGLKHIEKDIKKTSVQILICGYLPMKVEKSSPSNNRG